MSSIPKNEEKARNPVKTSHSFAENFPISPKFITEETIEKKEAKRNQQSSLEMSGNSERETKEKDFGAKEESNGAKETLNGARDIRCNGFQNHFEFRGLEKGKRNQTRSTSNIAIVSRDPQPYLRRIEGEIGTPTKQAKEENPSITSTFGRVETSEVSKKCSVDFSNREVTCESFNEATSDNESRAGPRERNSEQRRRKLKEMKENALYEMKRGEEILRRRQRQMKEWEITNEKSQKSHIGSSFEEENGFSDVSKLEKENEKPVIVKMEGGTSRTPPKPKSKEKRVNGHPPKSTKIIGKQKRTLTPNTSRKGSFTSQEDYSLTLNEQTSSKDLRDSMEINKAPTKSSKGTIIHNRPVVLMEKKPSSSKLFEENSGVFGSFEAKDQCKEAQNPRNISKNQIQREEILNRSNKE